MKTIEELAREAGLAGKDAPADFFLARLERFAAAVRRDALEEAAKTAESMGPIMCDSYGDGAECIATADACAEAIRALQSQTTP